jgi:hypothetical protein
VEEIKRYSANEVTARQNRDAAHVAKLAQFARAKEIVAANELTWLTAPREGDTSSTAYADTQSIHIDGGNMSLTLNALPIERLPTVVAFLKTLKEAP